MDAECQKCECAHREIERLSAVSATVGELEKIEALLDAAGIDDHHGGGGESYYRYSTTYRVENALTYKKMFEESEQHCERMSGVIRYLLFRWKRSGRKSPNDPKLSERRADEEGGSHAR